jgi:hypothetical protein
VESKEMLMDNKLKAKMIMAGKMNQEKQGRWPTLPVRKYNRVA